MPQERENQYPHVKPEEWNKIKAEIPREVAAARLLMARKITGIPRRPFLVGDNDGSPILHGLVEFCAEVYKLVDAIDAANDAERATDRIIDANADLVQMMEEFPK